MLKYSFDLKVKDAWPPFAAESLWLEETPDGYRVKTFPFFIEGVAFDDVIKIVKLDAVRAQLSGVVRQSGNSTIWLYFRQGVNPEPILGRLVDVGIGIEGGAVPGYYALNLPADVTLKCLDQIVSSAEQAGQVEVVYGAMRHTE